MKILLNMLIGAWKPFAKCSLKSSRSFLKVQAWVEGLRNIYIYIILFWRSWEVLLIVPSGIYCLWLKHILLVNTKGLDVAKLQHKPSPSLYCFAGPIGLLGL